MANRHAQFRPHCVDLSPSAYAAGSNDQYDRSRTRAARNHAKAAEQFALLKPEKRLTINSEQKNAGAIRLSVATPRPGSRHTSKLTAALVAIAGGILWTTTTTGTVEDRAALPPIAKAGIAPPAFFFDDEADALATIGQKSDIVDVAKLNSANEPAPQITTTPVALLNTPTTELPLAEASTDIKTTVISELAEPPSLAAARQQAAAPEGVTKISVKVASGDTLSGILNEHGVKMEQMPQLLKDDIVKQHLSNLKIDQIFELFQLPGGEFHSLSAKIGNDRRITIRRSANDFAIASIDLPVEKERVVTSGTIEQSLYLAAEKAQLKQSTIMELSDIFQWELDFARDIRKGDQFSLVYDRLYREGKYISDGDILAAEFIRGGKIHRAIRFTTDDGTTGYYSSDGESKRRTFKRHPVDVVRITSKFNPNRLHPVLHKIRAHRGVDYGSPHGSPIYATADGSVSFSGSKSSYGNTVILKHGQRFSTLYAHMSKISKNSKVGKKVKQGDVIGYVGKTGRVTGTHLHYEFRVDNKQIDPLKVELPAAQPIAKKYLPALKAVSDEMTAQMRSVLIGIDQQVASVITNPVLQRDATSKPDQ